MRMRGLLKTSAVALAVGGAIALGGCGTNQGQSFMRGSDRVTQVQRPEEFRKEVIPLGVGGGGGAGSGDPGSIQNGTPKPLGIPAPGTSPQSAPSQQQGQTRAPQR